MRSETIHGVTRKIATVAVWVIAAILLSSAVYTVVMTDSLVVRLGILAVVIWVMATVYMIHRGATGLAWLYRPDEAEAFTRSGNSDG